MHGRGETHNVPADALLIDGKGLHSELHSAEAGGLPNKIRCEIMSAF
jgi:hypothetical protein